MVVRPPKQKKPQTLHVLQELLMRSARLNLIYKKQKQKAEAEPSCSELPLYTRERRMSKFFHPIAPLLVMSSPALTSPFSVPVRESLPILPIPPIIIPTSNVALLQTGLAATTNLTYLTVTCSLSTPHLRHQNLPSPQLHDNKQGQPPYPTHCHNAHDSPTHRPCHASPVNRLPARFRGSLEPCPHKFER